MIYYDLTLPAFEATASDVRFADALPRRVEVAEVRTNVYMANGFSGAGSGVFPPVGKVRSPESYGPTGTEYVGTETLPAEAEVQTGVGYGAGGTEFTGSLAAGGGSRGLIGG